jgi:hypothetical protein
MICKTKVEAISIASLQRRTAGEHAVLRESRRKGSSRRRGSDGGSEWLLHAAFASSQCLPHSKQYRFIHRGRGAGFSANAGNPRAWRRFQPEWMAASSGQPRNVLFFPNAAWKANLFGSFPGGNAPGFFRNEVEAASGLCHFALPDVAFSRIPLNHRRGVASHSHPPNIQWEQQGGLAWYNHGHSEHVTA